MDNFGIYKAIVTDNTSFFKTGKIKVRIQNLYSGRIDWDLSKTYDSATHNSKLFDDLEALVFTTIGGGSGYGMFALPQINSVGLVQYLNGNVNNPVWMGSFYIPEYDEKMQVSKVKIPNDQEIMEGLGSDGILKKGKQAEKNIEGGFGSIILRTKTTESPGTDKKPEKMDFNKRRSENLFVLNENEAKIVHLVNGRI
jgi:hypothetical protein